MATAMLRLISPMNHAASLPTPVLMLKRKRFCGRGPSGEVR
jgi:hypothetical protein